MYIRGASNRIFCRNKSLQFFHVLRKTTVKCHQSSFLSNPYTFFSLPSFLSPQAAEPGWKKADSLADQYNSKLPQHSLKVTTSSTTFPRLITFLDKDFTFPSLVKLQQPLSFSHLISSFLSH